MSPPAAGAAAALIPAGPSCLWLPSNKMGGTDTSRDGLRTKQHSLGPANPRPELACLWKWALPVCSPGAAFCYDGRAQGPPLHSGHSPVRGLHRLRPAGGSGLLARRAQAPGFPHLRTSLGSRGGFHGHQGPSAAFSISAPPASSPGPCRPLGGHAPRQRCPLLVKVSLRGLPRRLPLLQGCLENKHLLQSQPGLQSWGLPR